MFFWGSLSPWLKMAVLLGIVCSVLFGVAISCPLKAFLKQSTLQMISFLLSKLLSSSRLISLRLFPSSLLEVWVSANSSVTHLQAVFCFMLTDG